MRSSVDSVRIYVDVICTHPFIINSQIKQRVILVTAESAQTNLQLPSTMRSIDCFCVKKLADN